MGTSIDAHVQQWQWQPLISGCFAESLSCMPHGQFVELTYPLPPSCRKGEKNKEKFEKNCERKNASPGNQKRTAGRSIRYSKFISNSDGPAGRDAITLGQEWKVRATCICLLHYTQYISFKLISRTHTHTETQLSVPKLFWQIQCHLLEKLATWHLTSRRDWARSRVQNFPKWLGYAQTLCLCKIESRTKSEPNKNSLVPWPGPLV